MTKRSRGPRSKTRRKLKGRLKEKFKVEDSLKKFVEGESVVISQNPRVQKGMPHVRFKGLIGKIIEKRGESYAVKFNISKKQKEIVVRPEHLRPAANINKKANKG